MISSLDKTFRCFCLLLVLALYGCDDWPRRPSGKATTAKKIVAVEEAEEAIVDKDYC
ncbi:MAG: hypothetical protein GXP29_06560, partial [Planctomycetes bacterium]|nr:hypothetical protein [Planctomycetota bacterium]